MTDHVASLARRVAQNERLLLKLATHEFSQGQAIWPVGSIFTAVVATNPGTLLGFGTWAAYAAGRVLVGIDAGQAEFDTLEETGGSKTHTISSGEMPSHTHVQNSHNHTQNAHDHLSFNASKYTVQQAGSGGNYTFDSGGTTLGIATGTKVAVNQSATAVNQSTGGGGAHNNLQPYIVVYMWERTA